MPLPMKPTFLIVNADDFGCFDGVSRGIVETVKNGIVTATGVIANSPGLERQVGWLEGLAELDVGVHLNLTAGEPLCDPMRAQLERWNGRFPRKLALVSAVARGSITGAAVASEWRAQIERCHAMRLKPRFLNSHEHVHMLPALYHVASDLAREFDIPHVRCTRPEWRARHSPGSLTRNLSLAALVALGCARGDGRILPAPIMLGLAESGRLNHGYLERRLATLREGGVYELMCHPGILDPDQRIERRIMAYHDWDTERKALCSAAVRELLRHHGIRLIGYRHLKICGKRLDIAGRDASA